VSTAGDKCILAIDLGTSAVKLAAVTLRGRILGGEVESHPLRVIGGGARSRLWCQIHADVLNRRIQQVDEPVYAPHPRNRALYDELFREFVNLYQSNKSIFARLNRARSA
jgi:xylulokinase